MTTLEWIVAGGFAMVCLYLHILSGHILHISTQLDQIRFRVERIETEVCPKSHLEPW